jgi:hypothetical protein
MMITGIRKATIEQGRNKAIVQKVKNKRIKTDDSGQMYHRVECMPFLPFDFDFLFWEDGCGSDVMSWKTWSSDVCR